MPAAQGRGRFKTGVRLYQQEAPLPAAACWDVLNQPTGCVLGLHGHVHTNEPLLQNTGTRWRKGKWWPFFARLVGHELVKFANSASKFRSCLLASLVLFGFGFSKQRLKHPATLLLRFVLDTCFKDNHCHHTRTNFLKCKVKTGPTDFFRSVPF